MSSLQNQLANFEFSFSDLLLRIDKRNDCFTGRSVVLVVGNTGSGKSTFVNYAVGKRLIRDSKTVFGSVTYSCEDYVMKIGSSATQSETSLFETYYDSTADITYCDCPGFSDTRGALIDIENAFILKSLSSCNTLLKGIVVIISYHSIMSDRGKSLRDAASSVQGIVGDRLHSQKVLDSLLILINRVPKDVCVEDLRTYIGECDDLPFGQEVIRKINIYYIEDDRHDALKKKQIIERMRAFGTFPSAYLSIHLSSTAEALLLLALSTETRRILKEFDDGSSAQLFNYSSAVNFRSVNNALNDVRKLEVLEIDAVKDLITTLLQNLTSKVHAMASSETKLRVLEQINENVSELSSIAISSIIAIKRRVQVREKMRQQEQELQLERQRERERAESQRRAAELAEEERKRLQRERERAQQERDEEVRRLQQASRHQGRVVVCAQLVLHPFFGPMQVQQHVWSCCGSSDINNPTCSAGRYRQEQQHVYFTL
jgi:ABC-type oligopeptide transport system ATPase subunit